MVVVVFMFRPRKFPAVLFDMIVRKPSQGIEALSAMGSTKHATWRVCILVGRRLLNAGATLDWLGIL